jgi:nuclear pore complex protein Nup88
MFAPAPSSPSLFDHVAVDDARSSRAHQRVDDIESAMSRTNAVSEDERGVVYVVNARGEIRSTPSRDVVSYARDVDASTIASGCLPATRYLPQYAPTFVAEHVCASPSGRLACVHGRGGEGAGERRRGACYVACLSASDSSTAGSDRTCVTARVCEDAFEAVASTRVVRCAWHPNADATLAMLTSDGVFRLINCDDVASSGKVVVEKSWRLDIDGSFPESSPVRPDVVDFAFAPANGWGAFTVYFLTKSGDVHGMCPVVARGAKYPRVTLTNLAVENETTAMWMDDTFPDLSDKRVPVVAAHAAASDTGGPVALQGPLPRRQAPRMAGSDAEEDALELAISAFSGGGGSGNVVATLHAGAVHIHIIPSELKPAWCEGPFQNMRGYTFTMSNASASADDLPSLMTVDTIQLSSSPGTQSLAKVQFASVRWDPALRERVFACINGVVHSIVLTWLPVLEMAAEDMVDENKNEAESLPLPHVETLCDVDAPLLGLHPLGDPLAEGVVVALRRDGTYRMLIPPPVSAVAETSSEITTPSKSAVAMQPQMLEASSRSELRALAEGVRRDKLKTIEEIMKDAGIDADMKIGDQGSNEALAKCASALKEIYVDYARDVHDEVRTTALRLQSEIKRQKDEVTALLKSANDAIERHNMLIERIESAATTHKDIRAKLRDLAEREKKIPHPLTKAEKVLKAQMEAYNADVPLIQQRIEELRERAAVATEREDDDIGYVGSRRVNGGAGHAEPSAEDRKLRKALAEQGETIKSNVAKLKLIEEIIEQRYQ